MKKVKSQQQSPQEVAYSSPESDCSSFSSDCSSDGEDASSETSSMVHIDFDFTSLHMASIPCYGQLLRSLLAPILPPTPIPTLVDTLVQAFCLFLTSSPSSEREQGGWLSESKGTAVLQAQGQGQEAPEPEQTLPQVDSDPIWPLVFLSIVPLRCLTVAQQAVFERWLDLLLLRCSTQIQLDVREVGWIVKCASVHNLPTELVFPLYQSLFSLEEQAFSRNQNDTITSPRLATPSQPAAYLILVKTLRFISEPQQKRKQRTSVKQKIDYFHPEDALLEHWSLSFLDLEPVKVAEAADSTIEPAKGFAEMEYMEGRRIFVILHAQLLLYIQALESEFGQILHEKKE